MTVGQLLKVLQRRWYVLVTGLICTVINVGVLSPSERVYFAQTEVVFEAPGSPTVSAVDSGFTESLTYFAGIVERAVNEGLENVRLSSPTATLYGIGVHRGKSVVLADRGGQWSHVFDRPVLQIQVVDSSTERVEAIMASTVSDIRKTAEYLQASSGAPTSTWVVVTTKPEKPEMQSFGQTSASRLKGIVSMVSVGFGVTAAAACFTDRAAKILRRRQLRMSKAPVAV